MRSRSHRRRQARVDFAEVEKYARAADEGGDVVALDLKAFHHVATDNPNSPVTSAFTPHLSLC